jgi:hypothetical protein
MAFLLLFPTHAGNRKRLIDGGKHKTMALPRERWFVDLLRAHCQEQTMKRVRGARARVRDCVDAENMHSSNLLVVLDPGTEFVGPMTAWGKHERLYWEYFGWPQDAFSTNIRAAYLLDPPVRVHRPARSKMETWVPDHNVDFAGTRARLVGQAVGLHSLPCDQLVQELQLDPNIWQQFCDAPACHYVPSPLDALIRVTAWHTLLFRAHWFTHRRVQPGIKLFSNSLGLPTEERVQLLGGRMHFSCPPADLDFSSDHAAILALDLRQWAPTILQSMSEPMADESKMRLEHMVLRLDSYGRRLVPSNAETYSAGTIIKSLSAAMILRNRGNLKSLLQKALTAVCPQAKAHVAMDDEIHNPSGSTLCKRQVFKYNYHN